MDAPAAADTVDRAAAGLLELLHDGAPGEAFAARIAEAEGLAPHDPARAERLSLARAALAVRQRLDRWQEREAGLQALMASARDLAGQRDLAVLLRTIVSRARHLLGADVAWLSEYDVRRDAFHVVSSDGAFAPRTPHMVAGAGLGAVGVVVRTRLPFTTADYLHDARFCHDPALDATFADEGIAAMAGVPLLWEDEVIGLLFVADRERRTHTAQDLSMLSALATHAALAMKNALAFERARAAVAGAEAARCELECHVQRIQASAEAHEQMTALLAQGAPLSTLCQVLAQLMDGRVWVLDEAGQHLSGGAALGLPAPAEDAGLAGRGLHDALDESRRRGRSVVAWEAAGRSCRVNAVIGGDDLLGSVVLLRDGPLDEMAVRTFERSASVIAVLLLSRERAEASRSRDVTTLLRALLSARAADVAPLRAQAERHGLDLAAPLSLIVAELGAPDARYAGRRLREDGRLAPAWVDEIDGLLVVLCATVQAEDLRRRLEAWLAAELPSDFRGVLSRPATAPGELAALHGALRRALPVMRRLGVQGRVVPQSELALYAALFETHDRDHLLAFVDGVLGPLLGHDRRRGTRLAATLLCHFDHNQNATRAAERLGIHLNTMRKRLAAAEDLIGHWGQATRALEVHMALRLWSLDGSRHDGAKGAPEIAPGLTPSCPQMTGD